jgi:tripartite-type tricarboxylate transporter receptor subunit TctC
MPADVVSKLNAEMQKVLAHPDVKKRLGSDAAEPIGGTPAELAEFMRQDHEKWRKVISDAGLHVK